MFKQIYILFIAILLTGCTSANTAQLSFDKGMESQINVREALFVKAWGLNTALATEGRKKWENGAKLAVLEKSQDKNISTNDAKDIIENFSAEIAQDNIVITENFAYLSFLLLAGERADQFLNNVDFFIESKKPIWSHLGFAAKESTEFFVNEIKMWEPLIRNIQELVPETVLNILKNQFVAKQGV